MKAVEQRINSGKPGEAKGLNQPHPKLNSPEPAFRDTPVNMDANNKNRPGNIQCGINEVLFSAKNNDDTNEDDQNKIKITVAEILDILIQEKLKKSAKKLGIKWGPVITPPGAWEKRMKDEAARKNANLN